MADLSSLVGGLMKDPALIGDLLASLKEAKGDSSSVPKQTVSQWEAGSRPAALASRREVLLSGLKPYLKERTCTRLDAALFLVGALESLGTNAKPNEGGRDVSDER